MDSDLSLPSGNVFGVLAIAGSITIANFEHTANGTAIFTGNAIQANIIFATILWVGVTREWAGIGYLTGRWTRKSVGNLCTQKQNSHIIWVWAHLLKCKKNIEWKTIVALPSFLHSATWSAHMHTRASRSYAKPGEHWYRLASPFQQFQNVSHLFSSANMPYNREQCAVDMAGSVSVLEVTSVII